jgi:hypothetical protein
MPDVSPKGPVVNPVRVREEQEASVQLRRYQAELNKFIVTYAATDTEFGGDVRAAVNALKSGRDEEAIELVRESKAIAKASSEARLKLSLILGRAHTRYRTLMGLSEFRDALGHEQPSVMEELRVLLD